MTTKSTTSEPGSKRSSRASELLKRENFRRRVERAHRAAALKELGLVRPSAEIIPFPVDRPAKAVAVPPGGAQILLFTGIRRERWS